MIKNYFLMKLIKFYSLPSVLSLRGDKMFLSLVIIVVLITNCSTLDTLDSEFGVKNESIYQNETVNISAIANAVNHRKYGYSLNDGCKEYVKVFKCLTACKSKNFEIYRLNFRCKCTCHQKKSSKSLPYFKWMTTGTTKKVPKTQSPSLWSIIGTLSLPRITTINDSISTYECYTKPVQPIESAGNETTVAEKGTTTIQDTNEADNSTAVPDSQNSNDSTVATVVVVATSDAIVTEAAEATTAPAMD